MNFILLIFVYPIQNFTSKLMFRVFSSQLDLPFIKHLQDRECGLMGKCISHNIHFLLFIVNVKIVGLNFTQPFRLPVIQILLHKCLILLWSVFIMNSPPTKYCWKLSKACMMEYISLSYMEYKFSRGCNFLLSNVIGFLSCIRTTPIPTPEASHSSTEGLEKLGKESNRQLLIISFIFWIYFSSSLLQINAPFLVRYVKGAVYREYPLTNLR